MKKLRLYDIASFKAHSPAAIREIVLLLGEVIKDRLIIKNKEIQDCTCLTDKVTDISNIKNLLTFTRYYDIEKGTAVISFGNTCDVFGESDRTADATSTFMILKNELEGNLALLIVELVYFCLNGISVMKRKIYEIAAQFKKLDECSTICFFNK